jgi:hypothetical protein
MNIIRSPRVWGVLPRLLNINEDESEDKKNIDPTIIPIIKPLHPRVDASMVQEIKRALKQIGHGMDKKMNVRLLTSHPQFHCFWVYIPAMIINRASRI